VDDKDLINLSKEELIQKLKTALSEIARLNLLLGIRDENNEQKEEFDNIEHTNLFLKYFSGNLKHYAEMRVNLTSDKQ
jgi:hypothetical protein